MKINVLGCFVQHNLEGLFTNIYINIYTQIYKQRHLYVIVNLGKNDLNPDYGQEMKIGNCSNICMFDAKKQSNIYVLSRKLTSTLTGLVNYLAPHQINLKYG